MERDLNLPPSATINQAGIKKQFSLDASLIAHSGDRLNILTLTCLATILMSLLTLAALRCAATRPGP
jgi:hypothetical protein